MGDTPSTSDPLSAAELVRQLSAYEREMAGWVRARLPESAASDVDDVLQDARLEVVRQADRLRWQGEAEFRSWAYRILQSQLQEWWCRHHRHARERPVNRLDDLPAGRQTVSGPLARAERLVNFVCAVEPSLPAQTFAILLAHYGGGPRGKRWRPDNACFRNSTSRGGPGPTGSVEQPPGGWAGMIRGHRRLPVAPAAPDPR